MYLDVERIRAVYLYKKKVESLEYSIHRLPLEMTY